MSIFPNITLAVLAGGKASRIGGLNKALLEIGGKTFIQRIFDALSPVFTETIIITNLKTCFGLNNVLVFGDIITEIGPLGGIHSALVNSKNSTVFIVSCDMPFVESSIAIELSRVFLNYKPDILIPSNGVYKEPLFGLYSKSLISRIESIVNLANKHSVNDLLAISQTIYYGLPETEKTKRCFMNINSYEDYNSLAPQT